MNKPAISPKHRYPCGQIVKDQQEPKETEADKWGVALMQRAKLGATQDNFKDQRWGDPLGLMRLWATEAFANSEGLSRQQFDAIKLYCAERGKHRWAQGYEVRMPRCVGFDMVASGFNFSREPDEDEIVEHRRNHNSSRKAVLDFPPYGAAWLKLLDMLAESERSQPEDSDFWRSALGDVRCAANILARHYGLVR